MRPGSGCGATSADTATAVAAGAGAGPGAAVLARARNRQRDTGGAAGRLGLHADGGLLGGPTRFETARVGRPPTGRWPGRGRLDVAHPGGAPTGQVLAIDHRPQGCAARGARPRPARPKPPPTGRRRPRWRLARCAAASTEQSIIVIVSDGGLPADLPPLPAEVRYVPIGATADNLALRALAVRAGPAVAPSCLPAWPIMAMRPAQRAGIHLARRPAVQRPGAERARRRQRELVLSNLPPEPAVYQARLSLPAGGGDAAGWTRCRSTTRPGPCTSRPRPGGCC